MATWLGGVFPALNSLTITPGRPGPWEYKCFPLARPACP